MTERNYLAIYFRMGMLEEEDNVLPEQVGLDCPFDDSPVLYAANEEELERKIKEVYAGNVHTVVDLQTDRNWDGADWENIYPNLICDGQGKIQVDLYRKITSYQKFDPNVEKYSFGRETLTQLWEREKWRWVNDK